MNRASKNRRQHGCKPASIDTHAARSEDAVSLRPPLYINSKRITADAQDS